ncbi:MAG: oxidoreductase, partial [Flavobacteriales bacterium CG03_land_8_20_14_0_80_35_15]
EKKSEVVRMQDVPENPDEFAMILQNAEGLKKQIYFENPTIIQNNAILEELETFANAINTNSMPIVPFRDGARALKVAQQIIDCFKK